MAGSQSGFALAAGADEGDGSPFGENGTGVQHERLAAAQNQGDNAVEQKMADRGFRNIGKGRQAV